MEMNTLDELERQHKAVWDVIRANAEAIAENSGDEWAELCAVADDLSDDCDPNLARKAIVEAVAAINALPGLIESARRVERLEAALKECADELEAEFRNRHSPDLHPSSERRFNRDMETVRDARAALKGT
jgi:hypothetical protein